MLACWACEFRFSGKMIARDGSIKGRSAREGGPYRLYTCPRCSQVSRVETTAKDRMFASPPKDFSVVDYFFGWLDFLSPTDFLRVVRWHHSYAETRREYFERDGDSTYSKPTISGTVRQFLAGRSATSDLEFEEWRQRREEEILREKTRTGRSDRHKSEEPNPRRDAKPSPPPREVPHPYRILGVSIDATDGEIRTAFKTLVRVHHPDKQPTRDPEVLEEANRRLKELLQAYDELSKR